MSQGCIRVRRRWAGGAHRCSNRVTNNRPIQLERSYTHEDHRYQEGSNHQKTAELLPMGCGGGSSQLVIKSRASARPLRLHRRRTTLRLWCGVIFLSVLPACSPSQQLASPNRNVLTIGFPEGQIASAETGLGQLITGFTLEGLTQVNVDGRAMP